MPADLPRPDAPQAASSFPRGPDRRTRPTPILSRYTFFGGRRRGGRRDGEAHNSFVDLYSPRLAALLLVFFALTVVDSVATVFYLQKGGQELNPIARAMLEHGNVAFVLYKGSLTAVCILFVMLHKNFRYARYAVIVGFVFYFALAIYHTVLQVRAWHLPAIYSAH